MRTISRKGDIQTAWEACEKAFVAENVGLFVEKVHELILSQKVKFPLLEYCATESFKLLQPEAQIPFCDAVEKLKTEGGNVILGKLLQLRLAGHFNQSLEKATAYIANADIWYVCDIIGERVFGHALLCYPTKMLPEYKRLSAHSTNWVVRALGAGGHYAIKKGLAKKDAEQLFEVLLTMANTNDKEVRQGVGWAAKTTAKYHPDIIARYQKKIENDGAVAKWFRRKIDIGLHRNTYARGS